MCLRRQCLKDFIVFCVLTLTGKEFHTDRPEIESEEHWPINARFRKLYFYLFIRRIFRAQEGKYCF